MILAAICSRSSEDLSYSRGQPWREKTEGSSIVSSIGSSSLMNSQSLSPKIDNVSTIVWQGSVLTMHSLHHNRPPQVGLQKPLAKGNHPLAWCVVNNDVFFLWGGVVYSTKQLESTPSRGPFEFPARDRKTALNEKLQQRLESIGELQDPDDGRQYSP